MTTVEMLGGRTDIDLQRDVLDELNRDYRFRPGQIGVEVQDGVVTLDGTVSSWARLGDAAELATAVPGVKDVANKIVVEIPHEARRDDARIAHAVREALEWDVSVPDDRIDSIVRAGAVTLKGTVAHSYERENAVRAVTRLTGVRAVNDHIVVVPPKRTDQELYDEIKRALRRRLPLESIDVAVEDATVTLMGRVGRYDDVRAAERIARGTTGVKDVLNRLLIHP